MPLPVATYACQANAQLTFTVSGRGVSQDPETGNAVVPSVQLEYLAVLQLSRPNHQEAAGADQSLYQAKGRLLYPPTLDPRITNGAQAEAVINGHRGRFEFLFDLNQDPNAYAVLRQSIEGTFRVIGGRGDAR